MTGIASTELLTELEAAAREATPERRARILQRVTELYLRPRPSLSPGQISVFDDVLVHLMERIEARKLAELSAALANVTPAPQATIRRLARQQNASIAVPVLLKSESLTDADLIEIASHFSQQHLIAISSRPHLNEALTDVILKHAGKETARVLARNPTAWFSTLGRAALLIVAERDENVAESLGSRPDLPAQSLQKLLARTDGHRARAAPQVGLSAGSQKGSGGAGQRAGPVVPTTTTAASNDYAEAKAAVVVLNKSGQLNDSSVNRFAIRREYPNVIAALTLLSGATVEIIAPLMEEESGNGLIIACRGSRLNWSTTIAVLNNRRVPPLSKAQLAQLKEVFEMLYVSAAQYTIRFEPPVSAAAQSAVGGTAAAAAEVDDERRESKGDPCPVRTPAIRSISWASTGHGGEVASCSMFPKAAQSCEIEGSPDVLRAREFFLLLSSTGLAFRRCELVWVDGTQVGVKFTSPDKGKKARAANTKSTP